MLNDVRALRQHLDHSSTLGKEVEGEPVWYGRKKESRREVKLPCVTKDGSLGDQDVWMQAKLSETLFCVESPLTCRQKHSETRHSGAQSYLCRPHYGIHLSVE